MTCTVLLNSLIHAYQFDKKTNENVLTYQIN